MNDCFQEERPFLLSMFGNYLSYFLSLSAWLRQAHTLTHTFTHAHTHKHTQTSCGRVVTNPGDEKRLPADRMSVLSRRRLTSESIKGRLNQLPSTVTAFLQGMQI